MNSFYVNLQAELTDAKEELWVQTQIDGAEAGKKILLKGELKDTDSVLYLCQSFVWERCLDSMSRW